MKTSAAQLKLMARRRMLGNYGLGVGSVILTFAIMMAVVVALEIIMIFGIMFAALFSLAVNVDSFLNIGAIIVFIGIYMVVFLAEQLLLLGLIRMFLNLCTDNKSHVSDLFFAFKNHMGKFVGISVVLMLIVVVLMIPLIVLAMASAAAGFYEFFIIFIAIYTVMLTALSVYVTLNYGLFFIILVEDPNKGIIQALKESRRLLQGNRGRLFYLSLSFIGWWILGYLTFGIGMLWIVPFASCTFIYFYLDLKPKVNPSYPDGNF